MFGLLFSKRTEREKQLADSIRSLKTLRVSLNGLISVDPDEIVNDEKFMSARVSVKKTLKTA